MITRNQYLHAISIIKAYQQQIKEDLLLLNEKWDNIVPKVNDKVKYLSAIDARTRRIQVGNTYEIIEVILSDNNHVSFKYVVLTVNKKRVLIDNYNFKNHFEIITK